MLAAQVLTVPPERVSFHWYGPSDASGFAAMGVTEILIHPHDVTAGFGLDWSPPMGPVYRGATPALPGRTRRTRAVPTCCGPPAGRNFPATPAHVTDVERHPYPVRVEPIVDGVDLPSKKEPGKPAVSHPGELPLNGPGPSRSQSPFGETAGAGVDRCSK
jgi:hypothetical protein